MKNISKHSNGQESGVVGGTLEDGFRPSALETHVVSIGPAVQGIRVDPIVSFVAAVHTTATCFRQHFVHCRVGLLRDRLEDGTGTGRSAGVRCITVDVVQTSR